MVRKTKEDAQETHEALLDAAEQVFAQKGVTNTTLNDVANAAGMTRGAIYWHFKDKYALFEAMCDRAFLPMEAMLDKASQCQKNDPVVAIREYNLQFLKLVSRDQRQRNVFNIILHRCEKNPDIELFNTERDQKTECLGKMQAIIQSAVDLGKLPPDTDTWIAMQANHAFLVGIAHQWLDDTDSYDLPAYAESMIDMFLAGLFARPPLKKQD